VALIPPPRMNMVRYHGAFAPNFKDRRFIVPKAMKPKPPAEGSAETQAVDCAPCVDLNGRRERMRWADMLKRTFAVDVTVCPHCKGRLEQIAVIKDRVVAAAILKSLREESVIRPLEIERARGPPEGRDGPPDEFDQRESW